MSIELKIKIKNLADEARTIRQEENKLHGMDKWNLQHHRKTVVRDAARRSQIAYQMIRGKDWESCTSHEHLVRATDWSHVKRMVTKYGTAETVLSLSKLEGHFLSGPSVWRLENEQDTCSNAA